MGRVGRPLSVDNPTGAIIHARGMTLNEVAERANLHRVHLSNYARGVHPWPAPALLRVAKVLGVPGGMLTGKIPLPTTQETVDEFEFEN